MVARLLRSAFFVMMVGLGAAGLASATAVPAEARVIVGFGLGVPVAPAYYYPPPAYYYYPPPVAYYPPLPAAPTGPVTLGPSGERCRAFTSTAIIDGHSQPISGTACEGADGVWRVVR